MTEIALRDGQSSTYSGVVTDLVAAVGDFLTFTAPTVQGRVMKLTRVAVSAVATAASVTNIQMLKRSTVDTAGTGAGVTVASHDPQAGAASTIVTSYTSAPTPGTTIAAIRSAKYTFGAAAAGPTPQLIWQFGDRAAQAPKLIGPSVGTIVVAQQIVLNISATPAGILLSVEFEFTEDLA